MKDILKDRIEFVRFELDSISDFEAYILPNVADQLCMLDSFSENGVVAIGALLDGDPCGVLTAQMLEGNEVRIDSITVAENYRRCGIGSELVRNLLTVVNETYDPSAGETSFPVQLFIHTEYAMIEYKSKQFDEFLISLGFTDCHEYPNLYIFSENDVKEMAKSSEAVTCFESVLSVSSEEAVDARSLLRELDIPAVPEFSFFSGTEERPGVLVLASNNDDGEYSLVSIASSDKAADEDYSLVAGSVFDAMAKSDNVFSVSVNGDNNTGLDYWIKAGKKYGRTYLHKDRGLYVRFE